MANTVELLAPAGSFECLRAAAVAGADAVYLGLDKFNARRGADNFTLETLAQACEYAHLRSMKVYLAFNTMVLPEELAGALECARQAWRAGVDAFIVQDLGIAAELHRSLPQAVLHASTQMNIHSAAGVEAAAAVGVQRVTLSRELSLEEIAHLCQVAEGLGVGVEVFAHGALCICYSGQCLMSSMIGGRSANRGTCAQACRLPYTLESASSRKALSAPGDYLLSPKDLCSVDLIGQLAEAGVCSLKIEGRMKSADYVHAVVGVYRAVLDRLTAEGHARAAEEERGTLQEAFSRGFTTAYLEGQRGNDIMSYQRPNNRGVPVGRVGAVAKNRFDLAASASLNAGDILEIWTKNGRASATVPEGALRNDGSYRIPVDGSQRQVRSIRTGDRVFRVRNAAMAFQDDPLEPRVAVDGFVHMRIGEPLVVSFSVAGSESDAKGVFKGDVVEPARTKPVTEEDVRAHIDRLGQTPFTLASLQVDLDEGVGIGFSALHKARSQALESLQRAVLEPYQSRRLPRVQDREVFRPRRDKGCQVVAFATNPACARAAKRAKADSICVSALTYKRGEALIAGQLSSTAETAGYPSKALLALPAVDHDPVGLSREAQVAQDVWQYVREGDRVLVDSMASLVRAIGLGAQVEVGPHVPVANKASLDLMAKLGVERVWLTPELTLSQIGSLVGQDAPVPVGCFVLGYQELMITEHCLLMSQGPCSQKCSECARRKAPHRLHDRKGYDFPVVTDCFGRSHLYNGVLYDVAHLVPDLVAAGASSLFVDTTLMNAEQAAQAVGRVVRARDIALRDGNTVGKVADATSGHLFRGVQ